MKFQLCIHSLISDTEIENKVWFAENVEKTTEADVKCSIISQRTFGLAIQVPHVISLAMT